MADGELVKSYSSMNHENIRLSTPYLNSKLIDYMAKVPSDIKVKNGIKKHILKEIAYQYIPKELIERPKCGFDIPFSTWMRNELKDILYSQINKKRLDKDKLFYTSTILTIRDKFYAGNDAYKYKLWRIFIFQLWYENFTSTTLKG
jgi:asparagine synthase (glutamine-hydrolysing)